MDSVKLLMLTSSTDGAFVSSSKFLENWMSHRKIAFGEEKIINKYFSFQKFLHQIFCREAKRQQFDWTGVQNFFFYH